MSTAHSAHSVDASEPMLIGKGHSRVSLTTILHLMKPMPCHYPAFAVFCHTVAIEDGVHASAVQDVSVAAISPRLLKTPTLVPRERPEGDDQWCR